MKINFQQAELIMNFIDKAEELFNTERPVSYQYMTYKTAETNINDVLEHITKVLREKPEVYERALRDLEPKLSEDVRKKAKLKYGEFEQYYNTKKKEERFNL